MEQWSALPSINGIFDQSLPQPTSSMGIASSGSGRRALKIPPKSVNATSALRRINDIVTVSGWSEWGNQTQRPPSTRKISADKMITSSRNPPIQKQNEHAKGPENLLQDPNCDPRDEVALLRDENATFRHENDQLRTQLVEKMHGQSKVVAGGQFRAASASRISIAPSLVCTKCVTARAKAMKARKESEVAQAATAELRKYVDKMETIQQQTWENRNKHVDEIELLRDKLAEKVEECFLIHGECTKLDKYVKKLQSEKGIDGTILTEYSEVMNKTTQCSFQQNYDDGSHATQLQEIFLLKEEVQLLKKELKDREQELKKVSDHEEAQQIDQEQNNTKNELRLKEQSEQNSRVVELERNLGDLRLVLEELQKTHRKEFQLVQETTQQLRHDATVKEREIQAFTQQHKRETSIQELRHQTLIKVLKDRIEQKIADINHFRTLAEKNSVDKTAENIVRKRLAELECQVQKLTEEKRQLADAVHVQRVEEFAHNERDKLQKEASQQLSVKLEIFEQSNRSMQKRISEAENEIAEQFSLMQKQKQSHTRALTRLMESSLRLCVVAPTVNVQLNTKGAHLVKKTGTLSTEKPQKDGEIMSIMCRSTPQQESIKRVIENDILPLFTSAFLQRDDTASPQEEVPMTLWLQELLLDMQARISAQLESIYSSTLVDSE